MLGSALLILLSYLLGSVSGALVLGRWRGIDIRQSGSGNAGGTNALRVVGWRFALGVVGIDVGKGALATWLGMQANTAPPLDAALALPCACAFAAVCGHCWPIFFGFRGGKGAGTAAGAVLVLAPLLAALLLAVWLGVLALSRIVSLATVSAALALPLLVWLGQGFGANWPRALLLLSVALALLITATHHANLRRLLQGSEPRIGRARTPP